VREGFWGFRVFSGKLIMVQIVMQTGHVNTMIQLFPRSINQPMNQSINQSNHPSIYGSSSFLYHHHHHHHLCGGVLHFICI
jgi:hypothetical protein